MSKRPLVSAAAQTKPPASAKRARREGPNDVQTAATTTTTTAVVSLSAASSTVVVQASMLLKLGPDVLAHIVSYGTFYQIFNLWSIACKQTATFVSSNPLCIPPALSQMFLQNIPQPVLEKHVLSSRRIHTINIVNPHLGSNNSTWIDPRRHPGLTSLSLCAVNQLQFSHATDILQMPLQSLKVSCCRWFDYDFLITFAAMTSRESKLQSLTCTANPNLTDECIPLLNHVFPQLTSLNVSDTVSLTNTGVRYIAALFPKLQTLNLARCLQLTDDSIRALVAPAYSVRLRALNVSGCVQLTDLAVLQIAIMMSTLQDLDLSECQRLTDRAAGYLSAGICNSIQTLNMSYCSQLTDEAVLYLMQSQLPLTSLRLDGCPSLTNTVAGLLGNIPKLRALFTQSV